MSGEFHLRIDSHPMKFKQRLGILVKLSFRKFCNSMLCGLHAFDNMTITVSQKNR